MAEKSTFNDIKIIQKKNDKDISCNQKDNDSSEKLDNDYKSDNSEDKDVKSKTINTERETKDDSQKEEKSKKKTDLYSAVNTTTKKNNNDSKSNSILQEKLKKIFMVREKGKYEYNKQEIPENLKYHSDSDSSEISEIRKSKKLLLNNNNVSSINNNNNNQITPKISVKRQNSGLSKKKELSIKNKNLKKENNIKEKNSEEENNSPNLPKNDNSNNTDEITPIVVERNKKNEEKKFNNFNKKILDNYIIEMNKSENNENENNENNENKEINEKRKNKATSIKDIIEKLKAKKIEKEDLGKKEKEAEEQSIMRRKNEYKEEKEKEKIKDNKNNNKKNQDILKENNKKNINEKDKEINNISKRIKERKNAREKLIKEEQKEENKNKKEEKEKEREREREKDREKEKEKEREKIKQEMEKEKERKNTYEEKVIKGQNIKKIKNNKSRDKARHPKRSLDIKHELPHKTFRDEEDEEDINKYKKKTDILNQKSIECININTNENNIRRKQIESDTKSNVTPEQININKLNKDLDDKNNRKQRLNSNDIFQKPINNNNNAYKKPINKIQNNTRALNVYRPKKPGAIRGRSLEKVEPPTLLLNRINNEAFNNSSNNIFSTLNKKNFNNNINSTTAKERLTYKKRSPIKEKSNFLQLNNSFCGYNVNNNNNANNSLWKNNISSLEVNNINNLNSSFDSIMRNYGTNTNNLFYGYNLNNSFYNNGNTNTNIYPGRINSSSYLNSDNISNLNINNFNTNSSLIQNMRSQQLMNFDPNSSFSLGYNNILNNSFLGINNINNSFQRNNGCSSINIEDLLILEEKLSEIIITLNKTKIVYNECFEFWNYYYNCSLYGRLEKLFTNIYESNNVQLSINYLLMTIMICYDFSFDMNILNNSFSTLDELLKLNHQNLIIIFEHILTKISSDSRDNIWVFKLHGIVNTSKNSMYNDKYSTINEYSMTPVEKIVYNTGIVIQNLRFLLKNYKSSKIDNLTSIFKKINEKTYEDINIFFREYILRVDNMNGSVLASIFLKENNNFKTEPAPYLKTINRKPYSLILDLDETLVHFKVNPENESEGVLRVRPGIIEFLDSIDKYYELIVFTAATQDYADLLIDAVEENKIYFEHRLYRQHTVIIDNDFVKDLSRVGRPLDKIAIVDNMPQNFRLQKENGINIKAFWGEEVYDTALIDLAPILINIAKEGGDIRDGLAKYKDEIVKKVTSNISKHTPS